ncbi:Protein CBG01189 [Caenorhabditis briggsae]|uniref:Protein CBG01189 n=1 Tax=Caenorhabditis briggsae TaxID=6238 RepID=A8WPS8_CAEBR|nr:Protein CBG01189 [Caenorhabditis briggsae]CAP22485.2 Protein CBG01189 [Caenorhabditis briggsae]
MNSTCIPDVGYFDSPKFLSMVLHMNTIISTPIHLFGFYCIIWKTPMIMKSAKLYLLNLHFWIFSFDYSISILMMPFLLIPHYAGYTLGVLSWFDVSVLFQTFMGLFFLASE